MRNRRSFLRGSAPPVLIVLGFGLTLAAAPTAAQQATAPVTPASITISDQSLSERDVRERVREFVRGTGVARGETPLARWVEPICPRVLGIQEHAARAAENMIRRVATDAGVPIADETCDSNILVTFAPAPGALVQEIDRRSPTRLGEVSPTDRPELLHGNAPIRWWYTTRTIGRHGNRGSQGSGSAGTVRAGRMGPGFGAGSDFGGDMPSLMHYESSIISTLSQRVLNSASVVIDERAVIGKRLDAIAAYAALVALAEIREADFAPEGSILGLFSSASPPRGLTNQDQAFLRAVYRLPLDREADRHRGMIAADMIEQLSGG